MCGFTVLGLYVTDCKSDIGSLSRLWGSLTHPINGERLGSTEISLEPNGSEGRKLAEETLWWAPWFGDHLEPSSWGQGDGHLSLFPLLCLSLVGTCQRLLNKLSNDCAIQSCLVAQNSMKSWIFDCSAFLLLSCFYENGREKQSSRLHCVSQVRFVKN